MKTTESSLNLVRHTWPIIGDDVTVHLTIESREPLDPEAYAAIADVVVAGDAMAEEFELIAAKKAGVIR